jgi:Putative phage abortive infection protein
MYKTGWVLSFDRFGKLGPVGDFFGGTTVGLFTLASIILVIAAIIMQKEELQLQRNELEAARKVAKEQSETITMQRFENTFFQMISLHNEIVNTIHYEPSKDKIYKGRLYFKNAKTRLAARYVPNTYDDTSELQKLQNLFKAFSKDHQVIVGHYFTNMYRILKFIDQNEILSPQEKMDYIGLLRAQLSSYELVLLLYNGISTYGKDKFLPLMRKYDLLQNLNVDLLIEKVHKRIYDLTI